MSFREVDLEEGNRKAWNYAFILNMLTVIEMARFGVQMATGEHQNSVSILGVLAMALGTMCETFLLLLFASQVLPANTELFNTFSIVLFLKFVLFASMEVR